LIGKEHFPNSRATIKATIGSAKNEAEEEVSMVIGESG